MYKYAGGEGLLLYRKEKKEPRVRSFIRGEFEYKEWEWYTII